MRPPIIMHVNYVEQGQTVDEMCRKAVDWGFDGVEFRRARRGVDESVESYLDEIAGAVHRLGLKHVLFGFPGPDLANPDAAYREDQLRQAERFYRQAAQRFTLTLCNTGAGTLQNPDPAVPSDDYDRQGSAVANDDHWAWAAAGFRRLGALAAGLGFRLAFEMHMGFLHDRPGTARRLVDAVGSPAVGVNLDYGNAVYFKDPPSLVDALDTIGDRLYYVHLKNSVAAGSKRLPTALAEGEINHREFLHLLKARGYGGPLCIEAPRPGDREWYARHDLAYLETLLADLGW